MTTWIDDLQSPLFWRAVTGEALGTFLLVFFCTGSGTNWQDPSPTIVQLSLTSGLAVATIIWCLADVSGAHINPAVTLPMLLARRISLARALMYVFAQCVGAMGAATLAKAVTPEKFRGTLAVNMLHPDVTPGAGLTMEAMITFVLVFTVFATCDTKRTDLKGSGPLAVGLSVTMAHLVAIRYTGSSMNPARTFGPAIVQGIWKDHWVYWCGPLLGGSLAGLLYENVYTANASVMKTKAYFLTRSYDSGEYSKNEEQPLQLGVVEAETCI